MINAPSYVHARKLMHDGMSRMKSFNSATAQQPPYGHIPYPCHVISLCSWLLGMGVKVSSLPLLLKATVCSPLLDATVVKAVEVCLSCASLRSTLGAGLFEKSAFGRGLAFNVVWLRIGGTSIVFLFICSCFLLRVIQHLSKYA